MGLCISTAWNGFRYNNGKRIIEEIKDLGFNEVELSFDLTKTILKDIRGLVKKNQIKVNSVHNFCPIPDGFKRVEALPDCYSLSSLDDENRIRAVTYSKATVDTAYELKAEAVVLHCGRVEIPDHTKGLISLYTHGEILNIKAVHLKDKMRQDRYEKSGAHMCAILKSLEELTRYAENKNMALGLENRFYFREIPSFEETAKILDYFKGGNIFYWHDTGHAQLWENLGFLKHRDYLENYSERLRGVHLHDIRGTVDHLAPLKGDFDFSMLKPYLKNNTIKTLEAHYPASSQDIISAKDFLEKLYEPN